MQQRPKQHGKRGYENKSARPSTSTCKQPAKLSWSASAPMETTPPGWPKSPLGPATSSHGSCRQWQTIWIFLWSSGALPSFNNWTCSSAPPYSTMDLPSFISYTGSACPPRGEGTTYANIQQRSSQAFRRLSAIRQWYPVYQCWTSHSLQRTWGQTTYWDWPLGCTGFHIPHPDNPHPQPGIQLWS